MEGERERKMIYTMRGELVLCFSARGRAKWRMRERNVNT